MSIQDLYSMSTGSHCGRLVRNDIATSKDGRNFKIVIQTDQPLSSERKNELLDQASDFVKSRMSENLPKNQVVILPSVASSKKVTHVSSQSASNSNSPGIFKKLTNRIVKLFQWLFGFSSKEVKGSNHSVNSKVSKNPIVQPNVINQPVVNNLRGQLNVQKVSLTPHTSTNKPVVMEIAQLPKGTKLTDKNLDELFGVINKYTGSKPYAIDKSHKDKIKGNTVYRPNHSGPHAARKVRFLETMFVSVNCSHLVHNSRN